MNRIGIDLNVSEDQNSWEGFEAKVEVNGFLIQIFWYSYVDIMEDGSCLKFYVLNSIIRHFFISYSSYYMFPSLPFLPYSWLRPLPKFTSLEAVHRHTSALATLGDKLIPKIPIFIPCLTWSFTGFVTYTGTVQEHDFCVSEKDPIVLKVFRLH